MSVSLEKQLYTAKRSKRIYQFYMITAVIMLATVLMTIYKHTVLDYATLTDVEISTENEYVIYRYTVLSPGRVDFHYGDAVMTEWKKDADMANTFRWHRLETGETDFSVRSRFLLFPAIKESRFFAPVRKTKQTEI